MPATAVVAGMLLKAGLVAAAGVVAYGVLGPVARYATGRERKKRRSTLDRLERAAEAQRPVRIVVRDRAGRRFIDGVHLVGPRPSADGRSVIEYIDVDGRAALVDAADVIAIAEM